MSSDINQVKLPIALNWHLEPRCNYRCKFCFAHFAGVQKKTDFVAKDLFTQLKTRGVQKITFVGGEPMLDRRIDQFIPLAKSMGFTTCLVTNGTRLQRRWLESMVSSLDWIGFSIDASSDRLHAQMGRGRAGEIRRGESAHLTRSLEVWKIARELGYGLKLNTVVSAYNIDDDMSALVRELGPDRWKVFQVLPIEGENHDYWEELAISSAQFETWVDRHRALSPVVETNDLMRGSYCMMDGSLRFFTNATGRLEYSESLLSVGIDEAWRQVSSGFDNDVFEDRGGNWEW